MAPRSRTFSVGFLTACAITGCGDAATGPASSGPPTLSIAAGPVVPTEPALDTAELRLRLASGMRFPLMKSVRQTVVQGDAASGQRVAGFSELEMLMGVTVEEVAGGGTTQVRVRFERITYRQDVDGRLFEFDSARPVGAGPPEVRVFASMTGDGFALRIGPDNRIVERLDFDAFLGRCLAGVAAEDRDRVTSRIAEASGDENIANFVDDSIGYLPIRANHGATAAEGDAWRRERRVVRPVRLFIAESCSLAELGPQVAEIDVNGTVGASETFDTVDQRDAAAQVRVGGGHSIGHCRIDRSTGLPLESRIERLVKLRVRRPDGRELDQIKRVETTIRTFPRRGGGEA